MAATLAQLAQLVGGQVTGDPQTEILAASPLRDARPGDITLADRPEAARLLGQVHPAAVVVGKNYQPAGVPFVTVGDPHAAFALIVKHFRPLRESTFVGRSPAAMISPTAQIDATAQVHPLAVVGDDVHIGAGCTIHSGVQLMAGCRIDEGTTIFPNAVLYENTVVGPRCIIHAAAVLGAYGFGYSTVQGKHVLAAQLGYVRLGAEVEVGAGTTIDRGTYSVTEIGEGTKIDNQVQIGHNVRIGRHNIICSQVGIAGSCTTGDYVVLAGQVGVADHAEMGDRVIVGAKAGIHGVVPAGQTMLGMPAQPVAEARRVLAAYTKLPEMRSQLKELQRAIEQLQTAAGGTARIPSATSLPTQAGPPVGPSSEAA